MFHILQEILILKELDIEGVSRYYGCYVVSDQVNVVMEYIEGETLDKVMPKVSPDIKYRIFHDIAVIIQSFHEAGVVHRDIKPQNIMIRPNWKPVVIDFGMACINDARGIRHSETGCYKIGGSPYYLDPFMFKYLKTDNRNPDKLFNVLVAADWWSYAVMLHYMYTGKHVLRLPQSNDSVLDRLEAATYYITKKSDVPPIIYKIIKGVLNMSNRLTGPQILAAFEEGPAL